MLQGALAVTEFVNADVMVGFAFETTLASRSFAPWIREPVASGYEFHLVYVWVASAELAVQRVAGRVERGGHHVAEAIVRRRYVTGLRNLFELYRPLATTWQVYDNSSTEPRLVAFGAGNDTVGVADAATWRRIEGLAQRWREATMEWQGASRITKIMLDGTTVPEAVRQAVRDAMLDRARARLASVVEENGRIRWISAEEVLRNLGEEPVGGAAANRRA